MSCVGLEDDLGDPAADQAAADELRARRGAGGRGGTGGTAGAAGTTGAAGATGTTGAAGAAGTTGAGGSGPVSAGENVVTGFQALGPCASASSYVSSGVAFFGAGPSPACIRLASGGTIVFLGSFQEHPLQRRNQGTSPSPIVGGNAGGWLEYEFPNQGFFPYGCAVHPNETGVIWVSTQ